MRISRSSLGLIGQLKHVDGSVSITSLKGLNGWFWSDHTNVVLLVVVVVVTFMILERGTYRARVVVEVSKIKSAEACPRRL